MFTSLPTELLISIFSYLDFKSCNQFKLLCRRTNQIFNDTNARSQHLLKYYGKGQVLYKTFKDHKIALTEQLAYSLLQNGCQLPRFLAQIVVKRFSFHVNTIDPGLYALIVKRSFDLYECNALFENNDQQTFDMLLRNTPTWDIIDDIRSLIINYKFYPVSALSRRSVADSLFIMASFDMSLVTDLVRTTGLQLDEHNEDVMEKLLSNPLSTKTIAAFTSLGFKFTDLIIKRTIAWGRPYALATLIALVDEFRLNKLVGETVKEIFGPFLSREESLNVPWNAQALHRILHVFKVSDNQIENALLADPSSSFTMDTPHPKFPITRPYFKSRPYQVWHWVYDTFGPHHKLTMSCFDDALSRAASDGALHVLLETFVAGGVVMRPRHIRILACRWLSLIRVLHRNMTHNALRVMRSLRNQVIERKRNTELHNPDGSNEDNIDMISRDELILFSDALEREVLKNPDWKQKARTQQLSGDALGTVFTISRMPDDVVNFVEQCDLLLRAIGLAPSLTLVREGLPRSEMVTEHSSLDRLKYWYRNTINLIKSNF